MICAKRVIDSPSKLCNRKHIMLPTEKYYINKVGTGYDRSIRDMAKIFDKLYTDKPLPDTEPDTDTEQ